MNYCDDFINFGPTKNILIISYEKAEDFDRFLGCWTMQIVHL